MTKTTVNWYSDTAAGFGDRLTAAREKAGVSKADLARPLGVKLVTVTGWEHDRLGPRANRLQMVVGLSNGSVVSLPTGQGEGIPNPDEAGTTTSDISALFAELRPLRSDIITIGISKTAEGLGILKMRPRQALGTPS